MRHTLSVIVPVYNAAPYLAECLDNIISQLWQGCKLILVNDESDDGSDIICGEYADKYKDIIDYLQIGHSGLSVSRNKALDIVDTDYVAFCDADDLYYPGSLAAMTDVLEREDTCDIVVAQFTRKNDHREIRRIEYTKVPAEEALIKTLYQDLCYHNSACAKVFRSSIFKSIRFAEGRYYEDLEIHPRLYLNTVNIAVSRDIVYYYRPNLTSFINTWSEKRLDAVFAAERILAYVKDNSPRCVPAAQSRLFSASFNIFNLAVRHKYESQANACWDIIVKLRKQVAKDPNVRIKNRIAALMSYSGQRICRIISCVDKKN